MIADPELGDGADVDTGDTIFTLLAGTVALGYMGYHIGRRWALAAQGAAPCSTRARTNMAGM